MSGFGFGFGFGFAQQGTLLNQWENLSVVFKKGDAVNIMQHSYDDKVIALTGTTLKYSSDKGLTYNAGVNLFGTLTLRKARILSNGIILLTDGKTKLYYSDDNLATINQCVVKGLDGENYVLHEPANATYPGQYYDWFGGFIDTVDKFVFGNYTNNNFGASPVNLYYSLDGITWKVFYQFGQNTNYRDDGTTYGGTTGTLLGNASNALITRHIHAVNLGYDNNLYVSTGDEAFSMHMLKCVYNSGLDTWDVSDLLTLASTSRQRYRSLGTYYRNGYIYWGSDGTSDDVVGDTTYESHGIYKCALADLNDITKHILLDDEDNEIYSFLNVGNLVFCGYALTQKVKVSTDYGETWREFAKPAYMTGNVSVVFYNSLYKYFKGTFNGIMEVKPAIVPNGVPYSLTGIFDETHNQLNWLSDITDEGGYSIERSLDGLTGWTEIGTVEADVLTYNDADYVAGVVNYYRVRAFKGVGEYSEYTPVLSVKTAYGAEIVLNGTFDSTSNWGRDASWTISGGTANYDAVNSGQRTYQDITGKFTVGKFYKIKYTVSDCAGIAGFGLSINGATTFNPHFLQRTNGTYVFIAECLFAGTTGAYLRVTGYTTGGGVAFKFDNLSIKEQL